MLTLIIYPLFSVYRYKLNQRRLQSMQDRQMKRTATETAEQRKEGLQKEQLQSLPPQ